MLCVLKLIQKMKPILLQEDGETVIPYVLKEEITEKPMIKCENRRGGRCPNEQMAGCVLQEGFKQRPLTEQRGRTPPWMDSSPGAWSPPRTFLKMWAGQWELFCNPFHRNLLRDRPKVLQRVPKTQVFDLCGFAMYVFKISGMHPGRQMAWQQTL